MSRRGMDLRMAEIFQQPSRYKYRCPECGHRAKQPDDSSSWRWDRVDLTGCDECGHDLDASDFSQFRPEVCRVCREPAGEWDSSRLEKYCSYRCRRIAAAVQSMFSWQRVRDQILKRDDRTCQECGASPDRDPGVELEVDHIQRIADGGHPLDETNLETLCSQCHAEKTAEENAKDARDPETRPEVPLSEYMDAVDTEGD